MTSTIHYLKHGIDLRSEGGGDMGPHVALWICGATGVNLPPADARQLARAIVEAAERAEKAKSRDDLLR